jgi:hypothetical protein
MSDRSSLGGVEPVSRILGGPDAGISQFEERDVGGHRFPSPDDRAIRTGAA